MNSSIRWMAKNHVAANLAMLLLVIGGIIYGASITQELFPEIDLESVSVSVAYPGAAPGEVETGICLPIEEAISSVLGIKELRCTANEGSGSVTAELMLGADVEKALEDIRSEVDRIRTFPDEAEEPLISQIIPRREVITVAAYGDASERALREISESVRDDLLEHPRITQVQLGGVRSYEIAIEVDESALEKYGLTLDTVARRLREASVDVPGGVVKTDGGEVLLRVKERRYFGDEYADTVIISLPDGTQVRLSDIANVRDGFEDSDVSATFAGKPAALVLVFRVGDQGPTELSKIVKDYVEERRAELPDSVDLVVWNDRSEYFEARRALLLKNGYMGLLLVFLILGIFLELRLAFWVTMGIPISFLGALLFLPATDVTINMISLFAFILSLGIVVDDAIIVGENIYAHRMMGKKGLKAAVDGASEVSGAVIFSVLTSVAAFMPMLFITGVMGKFMGVIPVIVISVLLVSLFESLYVLPAHLAHSKPITEDHPYFGRIEKRRRAASAWLQNFIENRYAPLLDKSMERRYLTVSIGIATLILMWGLISGGYLKFVRMPSVDGDTVSVNIELPIGTPVRDTASVRDYVMERSLEAIAEFDRRYGLEQSSIEYVYSSVGETTVTRGHGGRSGSGGAHLSSIIFMLHPPESRKYPSAELTAHLRESVGEVPGVESLYFNSDLFGGSSDDVDLEFSHDDFGVLNEVATRVREALNQYDGVGDLTDNFASGKRELQFRLRPEARTLGITESALGAQVRAAFFGAEAVRLQRGRDEVKVMVRYPEDERVSLASLDAMRVRTPDGGEIPFSQVADVIDSKGFSEIRRSMRKRIVNVSASVDYSKANPAEIVADVRNNLIPQLKSDYPGLTFSVGGKEKDREESNQSLLRGFIFAMLIIFGLLAVPFKSYFQPAIVMSAIPFGIVGAFLGHMILGEDVSMLSLCGVVALSGVVVNDSLIMVDFINRRRWEGVPLLEAVRLGGTRRFRQIVLTSLTTFFGLMPIIFETSVQAQFLIPMAISLGFGILFATLITLFLIPSFYLILEDAFKLLGSSSEEPVELVTQNAL